MLKYKLNSIAPDRRAGTTVLLPEIHGSVQVEYSYLRALRVMLRAIQKAIIADVLPVVERELKAMRTPQFTGDMDASTFASIRQLGDALARSALSSIIAILNLEAERHTKTFMQTAKSVLGVDLMAVVRVEDLTELMETAATRNAGLIKGLSDVTITRVQTTVTNSVLTGGTVRDLRKKLTKDFGFADSRAKVIARDQTAKFNSDLNRFRHVQAGITEYIWRTSRDERVRPLHQRLNGATYEYGKPTGAEEGLPPGQPIMCRCIAQAIVKF